MSDNAVEVSGSVTVLVLLGVWSSVIRDLDVRNLHVKWSLSEIGRATGPLDSILIVVVKVTSGPDADTDEGWSLREDVALLLVGALIVHQSADNRVINIEVNLLLGPVDGVVDEAVHGLVDWVPHRSVVWSGDGLSEVVGLHMCLVASDQLPIDFIKSIGLNDDRRDDSLSAGGLHKDLDAAKVDEPLGGECWRVFLLRNRELAAGSFILDDAASGRVPSCSVGWVSPVEVILHAQGWIVLAVVGLHWVTFGPSLSEGILGKAADEQETCEGAQRREHLCDECVGVCNECVYAARRSGRLQW